MKKYKLIFFVLFLNYIGYSQNTVGTIVNSEEAYDGYTLFTVNKETYLINNCGQIMNQWTSAYNSGKSVYLLENGNLLRASAGPNPANIAIPGIGGRVELFDWEGNVLWEYVYSDLNVSQHHDIYPMPNGNILILAASILTDTEAIQLGRDPNNLTSNQLYNEHVIEITPVGTNEATEVWRWDFKDHLIQDFDNAKDNFGNVKENPQLMDINFLGDSNGSANWMHINSVQYNEDLDQIILGSKTLSEIYIIDHSTTTTEAATSSGGTYGKGGDLLYRWGNPISYREGTIMEQKLFGQHYPHWIAEGLLDEGKIILYNNGINRTTPYSEVNIITPPTSTPGIYLKTANRAFEPENPDYIYGSVSNTDFYSAILSSAQRLPNGHILVCEGTDGRFFEIDTDDNIVWEYINPVTSSEILTQGDTPNSNNVFRAKKYAKDYAGFNGKNLSTTDPIELNPNLTENCTTLSTGIFSNDKEITIYPNPFADYITIKTDKQLIKVEIYNYLGEKVKVIQKSKTLRLDDLSSGLYIIKIHTNTSIVYKKITKK